MAAMHSVLDKKFAVDVGSDQWKTELLDEQKSSGFVALPSDWPFQLVDDFNSSVFYRLFFGDGSAKLLHQHDDDSVSFFQLCIVA